MATLAPPPPPEPPTGDASASPAGTPPPPRQRRWPRWLGWLLLVLLLLVLLAVGALLAVLRTAPGTEWALEQVPGLKVEQPRGSLLGDFSAERAEYDLGPSGGRVVVEDLSWEGATLGPSESRGWSWPVLYLRELSIDLLRILPGPEQEDEPSQPPESLALPLRVLIDALHIGEVHAPGLETPVRDVDARVDLGGEDGSVHRVGDLTLAWDRLRVQGAGRIGTATPLPVQAQFSAHQVEAAPPAGGADAAGQGGLPDVVPSDWQAVLRLDGPLARLPATATLRAAGQSLEAQALLTPFAEQPLQTLQASFESLNLAALHSAAPVTALTGTARLRLPESQTDTLPLVLSLQMRNAVPGLWNAQRLPLRELALEAEGQARDLSAGVQLERFEALLGTFRDPAGRVHGSGRWTPRQWSAVLQIEQLQPAGLDARAPAMQLSGPLKLSSEPPPPATPKASGTGSAAPPMSEWPVEVQGRLAGRLLQGGPDREVTVVLDGRYSPRELLLRRLVASSGDAGLTASGSLTPPDPQQTMRVRLQAELSRFDPLLWWPGASDSPWREGPHRLNGGTELELTVPPRRDGQELLDWLATLQGQAALVLRDSLLAGVPLEAEVQARSPAPSRPIHTEGRLELGDNRLRWDGSVNLRTLAITPGEPFDFTLQAPQLGRLAPLLRVLGQPVEPPPSGALMLRGHAEGQWPALVVRGELEGEALTLPNLQAAEVSGRFHLGMRAGDPLELQLQGRDLQVAGRPLESVQLQLQGTGLRHQLTLNAQAPVTPPWAAGSADAPAQPQPVRLEARLEGGVEVPRPSTPLPQLKGWQGTLHELRLAPLGPQEQPWLRTSEVRVQWQRGGEGRRAQPQRLVLSPGRLEALGATLRWDRLLWQAATANRPAVIDVQAALEPLQVAPLLRQFAPGFGWGGDLQVGGRVTLRSAPQMQADIELFRTAGDLVVEEGATAQPLGLSELRLAATARDGVWRFTEQLAGTRLGVVRGEQVVRGDPGELWPDASAPLEGTLTARVPDLGTWAAWLPAGWRTGGELAADLSLGGRLGAPDYTGVITGSNLTVRNILEGIRMTDGELRVVLQGDSARIERLVMRAGDGYARVEGGATFGANPRAELRLEAERFAALQRVDRYVVASGRARMVLDTDSMQLEGGFRVNRALIDISRSEAPSLSEDVIVYRAGIDPSPEPGPAQPSQFKVAMNVGVDLGDDFRLRGRGLQAQLTGDLRLTAPRSGLALHGEIRVVDGAYAAYGQNLVIERGVITFTGPIENPRLNVQAVRPKLEEVRVGAEITGTAQNPRVRLFSEPEMSETEKLSWLVLGQPYSDLGQAQTELLQVAAMALVSGEGSGEATPISKLTDALGLDTLSFSGPTDGDLRSSVIKLGKQLSDRWYLGYEHSLNATAGSWQLIYRIAERFTLRAQTGAESSALDLIWTWRW